jgi:hypothetical protein
MAAQAEPSLAGRAVEAILGRVVTAVGTGPSLR